MMIYEELIKFIKEDRFKNPKWKKYFNGYEEFAEFYRLLNTEIDKHDLGIYEKDNVAYLLSLESPYFFSYEITNKDARVVLITYNSDDKIINVAYSEMYSLSKNPDEFRALCERLQEDNYKEISFDDYADIIGDTYRKKTDATISLINETVEELLEVKNSYAEEYKKNPEIVSEFYMHDYLYQIVSYKNKIGWKVSFDTKKELSKNEYSALPITETVYGIPVISLEKCFEYSNICVAPHIPDTVVNMKKAFACCYSLRYAEHLPSKVEKIDYVFFDCHRLNEIASWKEIPETVRTCNYAFCDSKLHNAPDFSKANKITSMIKTFAGTLIKETTYAPNVKNLGQTFENCFCLDKITIPPKTIETMNKTWDGCFFLKTVPSFKGLNNLKSMNETFMDCNILETVEGLPENVESMIGTFKGCGKLKEIPSIPESVKYADYILHKCYELNKIHYLTFDEKTNIITGIVNYGEWNFDFTFDMSEIFKAGSTNNSIVEQLIEKQGVFSQRDTKPMPEYVFKNTFDLKNIAARHITEFAYKEFKRREAI